MPPESSAGFLSSVPGKSTTSNAFATRFAISPSVKFFSRRNPNATFSATVIESNSAAPWNTIPKFPHEQQLSFVHKLDVLAVNQHFAGIRLQQADEVLEQNAFAAAAAPDDDDGFAAFNPKADAV